MLLRPESGLLFWMFISFLITAIILVKFGFPAIVNMVEQRRKYIEESISSANLANEQLATIKEKSEEILASAKAEQVKILKSAEDTRLQIINEAKEAAKAEGHKELEEMRKLIEVEKQQAINEIRRQVANISVDIAEKVLRDNLSTAKDQMSMIDRLVDEAMVSKS